MKRTPGSYHHTRQIKGRYAQCEVERKIYQLSMAVGVCETGQDRFTHVKPETIRIVKETCWNTSGQGGTGPLDRSDDVGRAGLLEYSMDFTALIN